ncbi:YbhB/YbcL family Raf kinase inhibitor-like protein [Echinicola shivajiensis]|uniref:YbhB/YbcL family Raf kinase inhibitor-like protein n=1 Tax=Echinicola shivajiensis TaxID=1035916 RepID=UPI001BFC9C89|nr:YbhB/YbcL family Raf kinase inhibitor-like protein [Echinicola shivajiensis]
MIREVLNISCNKFGKGGHIPSIYTCDGKNINPPIVIEKLPPKTKSLVVIMEDAEYEGNAAVYWLAYNIPAKNVINEDEHLCTFGMNHLNEFSYSGPCPENGTHRYVFKVYALDDFLYFHHKHVFRTEVEDGIRYHELGFGKFEGVYQKSKRNEVSNIN